MNSHTFQLAQVNIARTRAPLDDPLIEGASSARTTTYGPEEGGIRTAARWVPENHLPDVAEAEQRLDHLLQHGPTREPFTFKQPFPAPQRNQDEALDSSSHRRQG